MIPEGLIEIFRQYTYWSEIARPVGREGKIRINYYLDLKSAVHDCNGLDILSRHFVECISERVDISDFDAIANPKRGNCLLTVRVAEMLGLKMGIVKDDIEFNRWIEGNIHSGDKVILLDDVSFDSDVLLDSVINLRNSGVYTGLVQTFVNRTEGDSPEKLADIGTKFDSCFQISDAELASIFR